jgi:hypothetical protein
MARYCQNSLQSSCKQEQNKVKNKWRELIKAHAFVTSSPLRNSSSSGFSSYSGSSLGFDTTIGVFLVFWGGKEAHVKYMYESVKAREEQSL